MNQRLLSCRIDPVSHFCDFRATVDVLRLDLLHPVVSGNKWFKLKEYLAEAQQQQKTVLTFGGAFSNHIVATAAAANERNLKSIGIIRGEEPKILSPTLRQAMTFGMKLFFTSRETYKKKLVPEEVYRLYTKENLYIIPGGGYGTKGMEGAKEILQRHDTSHYTHIISAVGTGTTLAGLIAASSDAQSVIGISVLKSNLWLDEEIGQLLPEEKKKEINVLHNFHFGGYAEYSKELIHFMNKLYAETNVPTDFVYTGKAFFAAFELIGRRHFFSAADKILLLHTGGLQGNCSLPKGSLIFG